MNAPEIREISAKDLVLLQAIGRFRLEVWRAETPVNEALFPDGVWLEPLDHLARHWVAFDSSGIVGSARLTIHETVQENPDGYLFERGKIPVQLPTAHLCKLVVHSRARGRGIAAQLNTLRIEAAKLMGAKSILVTASEGNYRLLSRLGFIDSGIRESFENRPGFDFRALKLDL